MVTEVPGGPEVGSKLVIFGFTWKSRWVLAEPPGVITEIRPVVAPSGTVVWMLVSEATVNAAGVPLKLTAVVPVKPLPVRVTDLPTTPAEGEKLTINGVPGPMIEMAPLFTSAT